MLSFLLLVMAAITEGALPLHGRRKQFFAPRKSTQRTRRLSRHQLPSEQVKMYKNQRAQKEHRTPTSVGVIISSTVGLLLLRDTNWRQQATQRLKISFRNWVEKRADLKERDTSHRISWEFSFPKQDRQEIIRQRQERIRLRRRARFFEKSVVVWLLVAAATALWIVDLDPLFARLKYLAHNLPMEPFLSQLQGLVHKLDPAFARLQSIIHDSPHLFHAAIAWMAALIFSVVGHFFRLLGPVVLIGLVAALIVSLPMLFDEGKNIQDGVRLVRQHSCPDCRGQVVMDEEKDRYGDEAPVFTCIVCRCRFCISMNDSGTYGKVFRMGRRTWVDRVEKWTHHSRTQEQQHRSDHYHAGDRRWAYEFDDQE